MTQDKRLDQLAHEHAQEDKGTARERAEVDRVFSARAADIDREAQRRQDSRQRSADQPHSSFEAALEAKLTEAGRAIVDKVQEAQARRELEQRTRERDEQRGQEDTQREADRREQYAGQGVQMQRANLPADERDSRHQYTAEVGSSQAYGRTMHEAARNAREVEKEHGADQQERAGFSAAQRAYWQEQHGRDR